MTKLQHLFDEVSRSQIDLDRYDGDLRDAAFDMITLESGLVGIADQLLSKTKPSVDQLVVINKKLTNGSMWLLINGDSCDLTRDETLLQHARLLISLQEECRAYLRAGDKAL